MTFTGQNNSRVPPASPSASFMRLSHARHQDSEGNLLGDLTDKAWRPRKSVFPMFGSQCCLFGQQEEDLCLPCTTAMTQWTMTYNFNYPYCLWGDSATKQPSVNSTAYFHSKRKLNWTQHVNTHSLPKMYKNTGTGKESESDIHNKLFWVLLKIHLMFQTPYPPLRMAEHFKGLHTASAHSCSCIYKLTT